jgi:hypothetical protein
MESLSVFMANVVRVIIQPVILLLFALAMYYFVAGLIPFVLKSDDPEARKVGRGHLIWGIIGFFIMTSVVTILMIVTKTFCGVEWCSGGGQQIFP